MKRNEELRHLPGLFCVSESGSAEVTVASTTPCASIDLRWKYFAHSWKYESAPRCKSSLVKFTT